MNPAEYALNEEAKKLLARIEKLENALRQIAESTKRQSLPLTFMVHTIATEALTE